MLNSQSQNSHSNTQSNFQKTRIKIIFLNAQFSFIQKLTIHQSPNFQNLRTQKSSINLKKSLIKISSLN